MTSNDIKKILKNSPTPNETFKTFKEGTDFENQIKREAKKETVKEMKEENPPKKQGQPRF